jgi:chemotaxis protein methyltransferase CheR
MAGQLRDSSDDASTVAPNALETLLFLQALEGRFGVDFLAFDVPQMQGKLEAYVTAAGAESISALQGRALRDEALGADVVRMLNRSLAAPPGDVFRLMALRCALLPMLRSSPWPTVWLADCTNVHDVVLLLALLHEEDLLERTRVFVTSGSEHALDALRALTMSGAEVEGLERLHRGSGGRTPLRSLVRDGSGGFTLDPALRMPLSWHVHHLATDGSFRECHGIIASRPLPEYGEALRARALRLFGDSLCSFGVLQLDDMMSNRLTLQGKHLVPVLPEYGVYRKIT